MALDVQGGYRAVCGRSCMDGSEQFGVDYNQTCTSRRSLFGRSFETGGASHVRVRSSGDKERTVVREMPFAAVLDDAAARLESRDALCGGLSLAARAGRPRAASLKRRRKQYSSGGARRRPFGRPW